MLRRAKQRSGIHNETEARFDMSAVTTCRDCKGVVVLSLTDKNIRPLTFKEAVGWFYELNCTQMQCVGNRTHTDSYGWGYYWNLDKVLEAAYPRQYAEDLEHRGGRQHFGVEISGTGAKVHLMQTAFQMSSRAVKFNEDR